MRINVLHQCLWALPVQFQFQVGHRSFEWRPLLCPLEASTTAETNGWAPNLVTNVNPKGYGSKIGRG